MSAAGELDPFADGGAAPERTQLAWHRTALALFGTAALSARLLVPETVVGGVAVAAVLAALGALALLGGERPPQDRGPRPVLFAALAYGTGAAALLAVTASAT